MKTKGNGSYAPVRAMGLLAAVALTAGGASADTWYLKKTADGSSVQGPGLSDLSYWTNSVGTVGSGAPTASDYLVIPAGCTMRSLYGSGSFVMTAKRLTVNGIFTHDWGGDPNWANDGLFLGAGSEYYFNWCYMKHPFTQIGTTTMKGTVTINGTTSNPTRLIFDQLHYSNVVYQVNKLVGAVGSAATLKPHWSSGIMNNTFRVVDASLFKGDFASAYLNDAPPQSCAPRDNGQYGGRTVFRNLDTPGTLSIAKSWTLGAEPGCVTKAATVKLGVGSRVECAVSDAGCSRLEATTSLTVDGSVQIFLTGSLTTLVAGRHAILTAPAEIDGSQFILKKLPALADVNASLETEFTGGKGTLYLTVGKTHYVDAEQGDDAWDGTVDKPKKTLAGAMAIAKPHDTVFAAEGTYDEGEMYSNCFTSNRVVVPPYVTLEASGDRDKTVIKGKISTSADNKKGCWSNAVRCVCLNAGSVVKGFTLRDGRTCNKASTGDTANTCGGAAYGAGRGLIVDSVITNCGSNDRGPNFFSAVTLLRCRVEAHASGGEGLDFYQGGRAIDSLICGDGQNAYWSCAFVNCTFPFAYKVWGNRGGLAYFYNCLHYKESSTGSYVDRQTRVYNSYFSSCWTTDTTSTKDDLSRFEVPAAEMGHNLVTYRPGSSSAGVGKGDLTMYLAATNGWPTTMQRQFTMKDMYGTDRLSGGALDLGAIQHVDKGLHVIVR